MTKMVAILAKAVRTFLKDEGDHDLIEYSLLVGLAAMVGIVVFSSTGAGVQGIWATGTHGWLPPT